MNQEKWEVFDQWEFSDHWKLFEQRHNVSMKAMSDIYIYIYIVTLYCFMYIYIYIYIYIIQIQELCGPGFCRIQADMMIYIYICGHL